MLRAIGAVLLLVAVIFIFLIARRFPFVGMVDLQFSEVWLWLVLGIAVIFAGLGGYLLLTRRHIEL